MAARLRTFVKLWIDLLSKHGLLGYISTSSIIFLIGVELDDLLREDATEGQRRVLGILGIAR